MRRALVLTTLLLVPMSIANADSMLSNLKDEWRSCATDSDCVVIHANGCPWDSIPVARRSSEDARQWAKQENMRHNCAREAVSEELKRKMRATCVKWLCEFATLKVED